MSKSPSGPRWTVRAALALACAATPVLFLMPGAAAEDWEATMAENRDALEAYFAGHVEALSAESVIEIADAEDWPEQREEYRQQLLYMLGLDPMPEPTPLEAEVTGTLEHDEFTVERVHFQSLPGLYVTANLYIPNDVDEPAPVALYLCGHASRVEDGVSLGNKTAYQHHPAWFARHGYVSLVVDTIQLGEIQGLHHGTHREGMWWWNSRGYTPAGVEAFNAMRAIDYLETREEADTSRVGVTGRSGGGIGSLYLAALDERVTVAAPVAGITDIHNHVVDFLTPRHCDCNYFPNLYRFDYARIVSLIAPRHLLIANTDRDPIFPLDGVQRVHAETRNTYEQLGIEEDMGLAIAVGGHSDSQPLRMPVFHWFNLYLQGDDPLIEKPAESFFEEADLRVFDELPEDEIVTSIHDTFVPAADVPVPDSVEAWEAQRDELLEGLREKTFRNWPETFPSMDPEQVFDEEREGVRLDAWDITSEPHARVRLHLAVAAGVDEPNHIYLSVADEAGWERVLASITAAFGDVLPPHPDVEPDPDAFELGRQMLENSGAAIAVLTPRGVGPGAWADRDSSDAVHLRRSFPIIGQTLDGQRVLDVLRTLEGLNAVTPDISKTLLGEGSAAGIALFAAVMAEDGVDLHLVDPPASLHDGPEFMNALRFMDMPQAVALALEKGEVTITTEDPGAWDYAREVAELIGRADALHFE